MKSWNSWVSKNSKIGPICGGILFIFIGWYLLHKFTNDLIVASPGATMVQFARDILTFDFWDNVWATMNRFLIGMLIGSLAGISLGVLAGFFRPVKYFLEPLRWVFLTVPPIMVIALSMIIFGMDDQQCVFVLVIVVSPIMYINTVEGIESIDPQLLEMGRVYKLDLPQILWRIYLPGIFSYLNAALIMAVGLGIRIVILAEVFGAHNGIGYRFAMAKLNLKVTEIYSWILSSLLIVGLIEFAILMPLKRLATKWKSDQLSHPTGL
jgi:NitT/TauT family transport system permease protein